MKARVFIASSKESLDIAYALQENLDFDAEVTVWTQGIFDLSVTVLDSFISMLDRFDFGVFIFSPDDVIRIRDKNVMAVRDNVVFELGLFISKLGKERNFLVVPRGIEGFHLPTDLLGMSPATFNPFRSDHNLKAALGPATNQIKTVIHKLGRAFATPEEQIKSIISRSEIYFHILNQRSAKSIDVTDWSMMDGTPIQQWLYHAGHNQVWGLHPVSSNIYAITSKHSNKCLTVMDNSMDDGAHVVQQEYARGNNQHWQIVPIGDGSHRIIAMHSKKALDIESGSCENGSFVIQSSCNGGDSQRWWLNIHVSAL